MKPIPNYPRYFADELGQIYSVNHCSRYGYSNGKMKKLRHKILKDGRHMVILHVQKKLVYRYVHQLVLEVFVGPRPKGMLACHGHNGVGDNSVSNLYWGTEAQNNLDDKIRDGSIYWGERHSCSKLNELQVRTIRRCYQLGKDCGITHSYLGSVFGVRQDAITRIINRQRWKYC